MAISSVICLLFSLVIIVNSDYTSSVKYYIDLISTEKNRAIKYPIRINANEYRPISKNYSVYGTFDHIVIGAGSAGAVVANRLSEDIFRDVLLLEAGGHQSNFSDIPSMAFYLQGLEYNWNYLSVPQTTACLGMSNRQCTYPRGKGIGGSSIINGLIYSRGNKNDYDSWSADGNPGWSYWDVLPFFKKSENFLSGDKKFRGRDGYLNVEYHEPVSPQTHAFLNGNQELGRQIVDYNGADQLGIARIQLNKHKGRRLSTGTAFLHPVWPRKNLKVSTNSYVIKILINRKKRAYGVVFIRNGKIYVAKSRNDIILTAGVFGSPQLLMLSGVGPQFHLEYLGIPLVKNLPVGNNLIDQAGYYSLEFISNYTEPLTSLQQNVKEYFKNFGAFTNPMNTQALAFLQTKYAKISGLPDIETVLVASNNTNDFYEQVFNYNAENNKVLLEAGTPDKTFSIYVFLLHPQSRGYFRLNSANPFEYPQIDPKLLSDPDGKDIETLYQGIQLALQMVNTSAFKKLDTQLRETTLPACKRHKYLSKQYWYCQLRQLTTSSFNPVGTCKMGSDPSSGAVVNTELKVHGIENLRIADTSVFPSSISGHPSATAVMIGEKVSHLIRNLPLY